MYLLFLPPTCCFLWGSGNISIDLYFPKKWNKNCTDFRADPMCTSNINALGDSFWLDHFQTCPTFHLFWLKLVSVQYLIPYLFMCVNTFHQDFVPMHQFFDHHVFIRKKKRLKIYNKIVGLWNSQWWNMNFSLRASKHNSVTSLENVEKLTNFCSQTIFSTFPRLSHPTPVQSHDPPKVQGKWNHLWHIQRVIQCLIRWCKQ